MGACMCVHTCVCVLVCVCVRVHVSGPPAPLASILGEEARSFDLGAWIVQNLAPAAPLLWQGCQPRGL